MNSEVSEIKIATCICTINGSVVFMSTLLSYIIPSGQFTREEKAIGSITKTLVIPGTL